MSDFRQRLQQALDVEARGELTDDQLLEAVALLRAERDERYRFLFGVEAQNDAQDAIDIRHARYLVERALPGSASMPSIAERLAQVRQVLGMIGGDYRDGEETQFAKEHA